MTAISLDLPDGSKCLIDEIDLPLVDGLTLYRGSNGYAYFSTRVKDGKKTTHTLHRLILSPAWPLVVDHINGDRLDNRRENLRVVSGKLNNINRHRLNRNNTSGVRGVSWVPSLNRWTAQIKADRKARHLGRFESTDDAIAARRRAELELFGQLCPPATDCWEDDPA